MQYLPMGGVVPKVIRERKRGTRSIFIFFKSFAKFLQTNIYGVSSNPDIPTGLLVYLPTIVTKSSENLFK